MLNNEDWVSKAHSVGESSWHLHRLRRVTVPRLAETLWLAWRIWVSIQPSAQRETSWHLGFLGWPNQPPTPCPAYTGGLTFLKAAQGFLVPTSLLLLSPSLNALGLLWWLSGKESTCQCKRCKSYRFDPWVRKIPWRRKWQPTPVFLPRKSHGQRSLAGYSPWGSKESDTTKWLNNDSKLKCRSHLCLLRRVAFSGDPLCVRENLHNLFVTRAHVSSDLFPTWVAVGESSVCTCSPTRLEAGVMGSLSPTTIQSRKEETTRTLLD